ncbi:MAG: protein translocase subunit SecF [Alphaproteobacteria bacterium]|nr:protein translocase subunit SecF [Alphaproteobacteria bacterium]
MALLKMIPYNTKIDFVKLRAIPFAISIFVILATLFSLSTRGINYGIDFLGGYIIEVRFPEKPDVAQLREKLNKLELGEVALQTFGDAGDVLIRFERKDDDASGEQSKVVAKVKEALGEKLDYRRIETVGPKVGQDLVNNSLKAVGFALIAMLAYIALRFEWQFAVCAIVALLHDCMAILGLFTFGGFEFKETAIIAILITAGYSINDTIVIFDRIRENIRKFRKMPLPELINKSVNETLSRTILTASTTLLAVTALYFMGGAVISEFSLPILIGILIGSFSSICLASPLLLYLNVKRGGDDKKVSKDDAPVDNALAR